MFCSLLSSEEELVRTEHKHENSFVLVECRVPVREEEPHLLVRLLRQPLPVAVVPRPLGGITYA